MSSEETERRIEFIIEQQARFSTDIEQLKEVQAKQTENVDKLTADVQLLAQTVEANRVDIREAINNLIIANEVTRDLAEKAASLAINNSQRITNLEGKG